MVGNNKEQRTPQAADTLQARPITALSGDSPEFIPVPVEPPPGFWEREYHAPEAVMPMYYLICLDNFTSEMRQFCDDLGLFIETSEFRVIGGWEYIRAVPLGGKEGPTPPAWLLPILARLHPLMRSRMKKCIKAMRFDKAGQFIRSWYEEWKPAQVARIAELREVDMNGLSDSTLDEHIGVLVSFFRSSSSYHIRLLAIAIPLATLAFACRDLLGWDDTQALELLSGLSERSSEPARRLAGLVQMAAERPAIRAFLEKRDYDNIGSLAEVDPEFAVAFDDYQQEFGCCALQYTFHEPTLAERPALTLSLIRDRMVRSFDLTATTTTLAEKRAAALERARSALASRPARHRERFEHALAGAEWAYPVREDNVFYNHNIPFGLVRYGLLELGVRLATRGQIANRDDVFFLEVDEAREALRGGGNQRPLVARRKAENAWAKAHPGPATYGKDPGPSPSFAGFPAEVRLMMNGFVWYVESYLASSVSAKGQTSEYNRLRGIAASAGRYTGPARVIMSEAEFGKIQAGDVLVCTITSPTWSILFPSIGALVTDTGGTLSHPAIIAREYGVPAVVATVNATSRLRDGQSVTVDGGTGVVEIN